MEIKDFIQSITQDQVNNWWSSSSIQTLKDIDSGGKYYLSRDGISVPFKKGIRDLARSCNIELDVFSSNDTNRNLFCQKFDFEIDELLIYNQMEEKEFKSYVQKNITNQPLFHNFIQYGYEIIQNLNFKPYHIRMALNQKYGVYLVVSKRIILSYKENKKGAEVRFISNKSEYELIKGTLQVDDTYDFKGGDNQVLLRLTINGWSELTEDIFKYHKQAVNDYYKKVKQSKLISWQNEAGTTNSFIKKLIFEGKKVNELFRTDNMAISQENQFLTELMIAVHGLLESQDHPLSRHEWVDNNANDYRQISIFEIGKEPSITLIHYEFMVRSNVIYIELHAEGNKENKDKWIPLFQEIGSGQHKLVRWKHGIKGKDPDKKYKKVQSADSVQLPDDLAVTYDLVQRVAEIFERFYADCNPKLVEFYEKISLPTVERIVFEDYKQHLLDQKKSSENSADFKGRTAKRLVCKRWNTSEGTDLLALQFNHEILKKIYAYKDQSFGGEFSGKDDFFNFVYGLITKDKNNKMALNTILYGPPGTGKTYRLQKDYFDKFTTKTASVTKDEYFINIINDFKWWEVIGAAVLDIGNAKVSDVLEHPLVKYKTSLSEAKNIRASIWGTLQSHTIEECNLVNYKNRQPPLIFNKLEDSFWEFVEDAKEEVPQIIELLEQFKNFAPKPDTVIKRYKFVTFHQSFSYEEFIEGIKPVMENNELAYEIKDGIFKEMCETARKDPKNPYAIFIDEINRGNVSNIFGELITLIEDDKRLGAANEMVLSLPYSSTQFGVPKNLHIIGTMNTADRSVEALDSALRRRFSFIEMLPDVKKVTQQIAGIELSDVLRVINERIELLLDRDHTIGHAYFMHVTNNAELALVFNDKIIPLLQEYFYGDYGKIGLVLGEGFVQVEQNKDKKFSRFKYEGKSDFITPTYKLLKVNESTVINALEILLETESK